MNRIMELINSGRAAEKLLEVLVSTIPAMAAGLVLLAVYCLLAKKYQKNEQNDLAAKLKGLAPYFYLAFVTVLWMAHNGLLPERKLDLAFTLTVGTLFYFVTDLCVFLILGLLFGLCKDKPALSMGICAGAAVVLELVQYLCRFGTFSLLQLTGMLLGSAIGIAVGTSVRKKAESKAVQQAA